MGKRSFAESEVRTIALALVGGMVLVTLAAVAVPLLTWETDLGTGTDVPES